jgi:glycosyltransferase involved in cell wall biosynthesis
VILVPSRWEEPFGNVALEGMACGCIPVVSDGGGLPDAVGSAGLTFKRGDTADMVKRIREILHSKELEEKLRLEALQHLKLHHPKKVADRYLKVIREAVSSRI